MLLISFPNSSLNTVQSSAIRSSAVGFQHRHALSVFPFIITTSKQVSYVFDGFIAAYTSDSLTLADDLAISLFSSIAFLTASCMFILCFTSLLNFILSLYDYYRVHDLPSSEPGGHFRLTVIADRFGYSTLS